MSCSFFNEYAPYTGVYWLLDDKGKPSTDRKGRKIRVRVGRLGTSGHNGYTAIEVIRDGSGHMVKTERLQKAE